MIKIDPKQLAKIVDTGAMFLHTPPEAASYYVQYVEELLKQPGISWGSKSLDSNITPMRPGEVTTVIARPGNGKTSFLIYEARKTALTIEPDSKKCVIYVTWEEPVESIEMSIESGKDYTAGEVAWGTVDIEKVKRNAIKRAGLPIFIIGRSMVKDRQTRKPQMTIDKVRDTILALFYEFGLEPGLVCFDYLQKIPVTNGRSRVDEVTEAMFMTSELAMTINCPVLMGAQATRDVDDQGLPIPTLAGAQWTSAIEQESFRMLGLLRPVTVTPKNGIPLTDIQVDGKEYTVDKNLLLIRLLKQRKYFPQKTIFPVHFDPALFELGDFQTTKFE